MRISAPKQEILGAITNDPRWARVVARDASADGQFYYAVKTTGVYCRPSCAARRAHSENVQFHTTREGAERAGFRPCRRCRPDRPSLADEHAARIARICRLIETAQEAPRLERLAAEAGMSVFHFHRIFKSVTGVTPRAYAAEHRAKRVRARLGESSSVTEAIYDAGFQSSSRFYEKSSEMLGMTPSEFRAGGADTDIFFAVRECSLGLVLVAMSKKGVCAIFLGDDPAGPVRELREQFPRANLIADRKRYESLVAKVVALVEQPARSRALPLDIRGTAFQRRVWQALRAIPAGKTASYSEIAKKLGVPKSVRAVGGACAANSLAVAIPCHRAIRKDGSLCGYRWGAERKRKLLDRESRS